MTQPLRWGFGRWGDRLPAAWRRLLPLLWPLLYLLGMVLISGGLGLMPVRPSDWGGLLLTLVQSSFAILLCFPLGVALALGRRSELPLLRWGSVLYIEFIRGAPLITLLFLGQNILGFLLPGGLAPDRVWRAAWVLTFFAAAYVAEAVRSGLAAVPRGQMEAALALGMTPARAMRYIVLPQAIRTMLPPMTNFAIVLLKDTSIVFAVGVLEVMALARQLVTETLTSAPIYLMAGAMYLCVTIPMARLAARLERQRQAWQ